jgi:hypothetical protein
MDAADFTHLHLGNDSAKILGSFERLEIWGACVEDVRVWGGVVIVVKRVRSGRRALPQQEAQHTK